MSQTGLNMHSICALKIKKILKYKVKKKMKKKHN